MEISSRQLKSDSCQMHQHWTDLLTPHSRQTQTWSHPTIGAIIPSFAFLDTRVATAVTSFSLFRIARTAHLLSQGWRTISVTLRVDCFGHCTLLELYANLVHTGQMRNSYTILVVKAEVKKPLLSVHQLKCPGWNAALCVTSWHATKREI
jgi:hypothetical protein